MEIRKKATQILKSLFGNGAEFRAGQYEAIEAVFLNKRTLVVQKTGWGKSLVYFTATKLFREIGQGVTLVISPLLVLMENQIEAAQKLNLKCDALNSTTKARRADILNDIKSNKLDMVFVTPETLFAEDVQKAIKDIRIGLFVIDEAHCISDWGHDFRLEYGNLYKVIRMMPTNVPILATTATANDRVVNDLKKQLGGNVFVSRGPLTRESLAIQVVKLKDRADRYTWLKLNINKLPGSGIIYCLTTRDCKYISEFLNLNGISAMPYHADLSVEENELALRNFERNEIKAIVATIKLGMGYDKGDIGFVVHFQMPSNIVSYYQQIGRAGRNITLAYAILMTGQEDEDIIDYFIEDAFPKREECDKILRVLQGGGASKYKISSHVNARSSRINKALSFLENEGAIYYEKGNYYLTANKYTYNEEHYKEITEIRIREKEQMKQLIAHNGCLSKFIVNCLDDYTAEDCGKCANCLHQDLVESEIRLADKEEALKFINSLTIPITPRLRWAQTSLRDRGAINLVNKVGICLSKYGDAGYGALVKRDKYSDNDFCEELIARSTVVLQEVIKENGIRSLTYVPSLRSDKVERFAKKLAERLHIKCEEFLQKSEAEQQKTMQNSEHQCYNAQASFDVRVGVHLPKKVILVDDIVDSKWTMTVCGYKLMEHGVEEVYPFALADSGQR